MLSRCNSVSRSFWETEDFGPEHSAKIQITQWHTLSCAQKQLILHFLRINQLDNNIPSVCREQRWSANTTADPGAVSRVCGRINPACCASIFAGRETQVRLSDNSRYCPASRSVTAPICPENTERPRKCALNISTNSLETIVRRCMAECMCVCVCVCVCVWISGFKFMAVPLKKWNSHFGMKSWSHCITKTATSLMKLSASFSTFYGALID